MAYPTFLDYTADINGQVEAEWLAFEILTLVSSRFGVDYLAAQSVVTTLGTISYQVRF